MVFFNFPYRCSRASISLTLGVFLCLNGPPAHAQFRVCNQTLNLFNIAVGAEFNGEFRTEGWWTVPANNCASPIKEDLHDLKIRFVYVYAMSMAGEDMLKGDWDMCIKPEKFVYKKPPSGDWDCWVKGYQQVRFVEVDTGNAKAWTVFFREGNDGPTLQP
jgi:uncharacterized membrane protein